MILSALSFLAGLLCVQQFSDLPGSQWLFLIAVSAVIMALLRYWRWLFFAVGLLWAVIFAMVRLSDRLPESLEGIDLPITGVIVGLPEQDERRTRFDLMVIESAQKLPSKIRLTWYFPEQEIKTGQRWSFIVRLKRPHGGMNPGGFDYERWLFSQNVGATGYVHVNQKPKLLGRYSAWASIGVWRQTISDHLSLILDAKPSLGLIKALTIGDGSRIDQNQWDIFRKTGTTHLVVISGSHVGLIAGLVYFLVLKLWAWTGVLRWSPQTVAAFVAIVSAIFYAALAGFSVPTERSVIMIVIIMAAIILQRNIHPFNTLAVALFSVLVFDPLSVLSVGFWLSFLAVALIIYVIAGRLGKVSYFIEMIKINWATSVGLSPLLLLFFQQVSLISPLANFIAVPIISLLVVPLALVGVLVMFISPFLALKLFLVVDAALQGLWWFLERMAALPFATITHVQPSLWALVFAIPGILLLLAPRGVPARWLSLVMFLPLIVTAPQKPKAGGINLTMLDVGQALSLVVQTQHHWLIFDTGAKFSEESDIGKSVILPFLRQQGVEKVDKLIISHGDNDHIGGAVSVLRGIPVEQLLTSAPERLMEFLPVKCRAGQSWLWDQVRFTVLAPQQMFVSENDNSCVLKIETQEGAVLLSSDIEESAEAWLVETNGTNLNAKVLIAPHHGSKTSSTPDFIEAVKPEYVLISAGYRNQFGHPHRTVIERYEQVNAKWLNNADKGAIKLSNKDGLWLIQAMRDTESKYWNYK
jgi:competence protein ComEC